VLRSVLRSVTPFLIRSILVALAVVFAFMIAVTDLG
jgi:hypothetical protein